jgi:menaquinone-specific isochorismate synthase
VGPLAARRPPRPYAWQVVSTAHVVAPTTVRTLQLDGALALLDRLPLDGALAWVRDGTGLVGWGTAARVEITGPDHFAAAERWWSAYLAELDVDDAVRLPGTGPVAFASFAFDQTYGRSVVVVPEVILGRADDVAWVTVIGDADPALPPVSVPTAPGLISWSTGSQSADHWQGAVRQAVARIVRGDLDKVVLARDLVATAGAPIDVRHLLARLAAKYPSCWTFSVDGLVGATPELLVRRTGDRVSSRVLAGTVRRLGDDGADGELADALMDSDKDLEEHEHAVHSVAAALAEHCTDLQVPDQPRVLRLANVQHLATDVTGTIADGSSVLVLAAALHPTAAVCGTPTQEALEIIRELEGMDRGRYAGPVGWVGADGNGEFGIALRCADVSGDRARLFAGCGIVAGSDADAELAEAQAKFVPIRDALESV